MILRLSQRIYHRLPFSWRAVILRSWYRYLSRMDRNGEMRFMNYGYAGQETGEAPLVLEPEDEPDRYWIQLYDHVLDGTQLADHHVLEIGSGRGGGASFIHRYYRPASLTCIELTAEAVSFCRRRYPFSDLTFFQGHAESLNLADAHFDSAINVESSHGYASVSRFLAEVHRVLKPGGRLFFADWRETSMVPRLRSQWAAANFDIEREVDITANILRALDLDDRRRRSLINTHLPRPLRGAFNEFAGVSGTRSFYQAFRTGRRTYLSAILRKPPAGGA